MITRFYFLQVETKNYIIIIIKYYNISKSPERSTSLNECRGGCITQIIWKLEKDITWNILARAGHNLLNYTKL